MAGPPSRRNALYGKQLGVVLAMADRFGQSGEPVLVTGDFSRPQAFVMPDLAVLLSAAANNGMEILGPLPNQT